MKDSITETELFALKGLRYVANEYRDRLYAFENAIAGIIGEDAENDEGWAGELIWNTDDVSVEEFLQGLQVDISYHD